MDLVYNNRWSFGLLAFVGLVAMSSKGIILYNEEILVALAFVGFVTFCVKNYSASIAESLDDRSAAIQEELQTYLTQKESYLVSLMNEHKKQVGLAMSLADLGTSSASDLTSMTAQRERELATNVTQMVNSQLKNLSTLGSGLRYSLTTKLAGGLRAGVLENLQRSKKLNQNLKPQVLKGAITKLSTYK
uniref:ATP synthase protein MI25 n=1 Tax=Chloroparvula japonica TaxID=1411623 RepID=A0A4D6C6U1_9CHLO|nr:ATP synthase F0 subunit beta [Chloroparvula japonica]QBX98759.1 ATP synthase F0 subunit beta [Chloroparvula japonica]